MKAEWVVRLAISLAAIVLASAHSYFGILVDDTLTWLLLVLAVLPWVYSLIEELAGPGGWKVRFREIERNQEKVMDMLVTFSMSGFIYGTLQKVYFAQRSDSAKEYDPNYEKEHLRFLHDHGYINFIDVNSLNKGDNLADKIVLTPAGKEYVHIREEAETRCRCSSKHGT